MLACCVGKLAGVCGCAVPPTRWLPRRGAVDLHELRPSETRRASLRHVISSGHAKAILLEGKVLLIGSMNLDPAPDCRTQRWRC